jgi:hypothetical protein
LPDAAIVASKQSRIAPDIHRKNRLFDIDSSVIAPSPEDHLPVAAGARLA